MGLAKRSRAARWCEARAWWSMTRRCCRRVCGRSVLSGTIITALPAVSTASPAGGAELLNGYGGGALMVSMQSTLPIRLIANHTIG